MTAVSTSFGSEYDVGLAAAAPTDWEDLLAAAPAADYSHTRHWHDSACGHRDGACQLWWTVRQGGQLVGGLGAVLTPRVRRVARLLPLHRLESSVEGTSGGPLLRTELAVAAQDRIFSALIAAFLASRPTGAASAAVALNPASEKRFGHLMLNQPGWVRHDSPTAMVSLAGGIETVDRQRMVKNKRNERNRGLRRGAEVFVTQDEDLLDAYYEIYARASTHWGVAPVSLGWLRDLLADPQERVYFTCARLGDQVIGGHLCLHLGARVFAWNGVTDPAFARSHFPATLCCWGDLVEACRRGAQWLDFGASGGVHSLTGFKRYFGAEVMARGFYVNDSSSLRLLRGAADLVGRARGRTTRRWHDDSTEASAAGGEA